jgi:phage baseplate assembly protein W
MIDAKHPFDVNAGIKFDSNDQFLSGEDAINQMMAYLFSTLRGERTHQPLFGTSIPNLLFEPVDISTAYSVETEIYDTSNLLFWIPYIKINSANSFVLPMPEQSAYYINIEYLDKLQNKIKNYTVVVRR